MARRVFFSFHYERDAWRAAQVRNSWVTQPDREAAGFWDAVAWEEVKKKGEEAVKRWYEIYPTYDWVDDNGYENFGDWVEKAAKKAGK